MREKKKGRETTEKKVKEKTSTKKGKSRLEQVEDILKYLNTQDTIEYDKLKSISLPKLYQLPEKPDNEDISYWQKILELYKKTLIQKRIERIQVCQQRKMEEEEEERKDKQKKIIQYIKKVDMVIKLFDGDKKSLDLVNLGKKIAQLPMEYRLPINVIPMSNEYNQWRM